VEVVISDHGRDFLEDKDVYILDIYNGAIYPKDFVARGLFEFKF
jgi:hypothetical protein